MSQSRPGGSGDPVITAVFGPPPPGMDLSQGQATTNAVAAILCATAAMILVILRLVSRNMQGFGITADDWLLVGSMLLVWVTAGISIAGGSHGAGSHVWALTHVDLGRIFQLLFAYTYVYAASVSATKVSLLLFYRRIFVRGTKGFHIRLGIAMFMVVGYPVTCWIYMLVACRPAQYFWTQFLLAEGSCGDTNSAFMALTVINMINDIAVLCVPVPEILKLQMSAGRKAGVAGIMLLGSFVCIASIVRIVAYAQFMASIDKTWELGRFFLWSSIEPAVGVLCACLPTLRPLFMRVLGRSITATHTGSGPGTNNTGKGRALVSNTYTRFDDREVGSKEDEIGLTIIGGEVEASGSEKSIPKGAILVKSDIYQA